MNAYIDQAAQEWLLAVKAAQLGFKKLEEDYTPEALNAAAATILIHAEKLQGSNGNRSSSNGHAAHDEYENPGDQRERSCPKCGGEMWDNRKDKKNPKAPDFKCKDTSCDGVFWPPKVGAR